MGVGLGVAGAKKAERGNRETSDDSSSSSSSAEQQRKTHKTDKNSNCALRVSEERKEERRENQGGVSQFTEQNQAFLSYEFRVLKEWHGVGDGKCYCQ